MRRIINQYGVWIVVGVVVVALLLGWYSLRKPKLTGGQVGVGLLYYVDEDTGAESIDKATAIPPLEGKDGKPTLVQEFKFDFGDGAGPKPVYLFKYTTEAQARIATLEPRDPSIEAIKQRSGLVRLPAKGSAWVPENSPEGQQITDVQPAANGKVPQVFLPR